MTAPTMLLQPRTAPADLRDQQRALAAAITADVLAAYTGSEPFARPQRGSVDPQGPLRVYHHAYRARLAEALRTNYPVLARVLGDEPFDALAQAYLRASPSRRPSIRWFGDRLAEQLAADPDTLPHPALVDLARMEWALGSAFDAADDAPLRSADLATLPGEAWPAMRFVLQPSVCLLALDWAIEPVWQTLTRDPDAEVPEPVASVHHLLIWRAGLQTRWRSVEADEAAALAALAGGQRFDDWCAGLPAPDADSAAAIAVGRLQQWIADELLNRLPEDHDAA
jgi:hypothetical protein